MSELIPSQSRRVDGIIEHVEEYLTLRFAHAERVNPKISQFVDDLKAQLLHGLRLILSHGKAWGAEKFVVADVLCGDDLRKRYEVFNLTGQYSILHDVITSLDEHEHGADAIRITDLRALYHSIDTTVSGLIELAQTWIWWDLPDAVCVHAFHGQISRIHRLLAAEITEKITEYYHGIFQSVPEEEITRDMMIGHEWRRLMRMLTEFELRRRDDLTHQQVLKREIVEGHGINQRVYDLSDHIRSLETIEAAETIDEESRERYAQKMATDPARLDRGHVLSWLCDQVASITRQLHTAVITGKVLGPPYDFKAHQLGDMCRQRDELQGQIPPGAIEAAELEGAREAPQDAGPIRA
jgi:hypothetical protein